MAEPKKMKPETIISLTLAVLGTTLFTVLLWCSLIGQVAYVTLVSVLSLVCLAVPVLQRLRQFDLRNLKMTLEKIEKVRDEVFAKEKDLARVSTIVSQLIAFNSAFEGRAHNPESYGLQNEWYYRKIKELLSAVKASPETTEITLKYFHALRKRDASSGDEQKLEWHSLMNMIREDIGEPKKPQQLDSAN
jgi:hypothetical protein